MMNPNQTTQQQEKRPCFDDDNDLFGRKIIAENIIKLIETGDEFFPLVIDGGWGTGKTTFVEKLATLCTEKDTAHVVYVDAFQADHTDDPFMMILAAVINSIKDNDTRNETIDNISSKLPALGGKLVSIAATAVLKNFTGIDGTTIENIVSLCSSDDLLSTSKVLLRNYVDSYANVSALKEILLGLAKEKRIIIIIDELDRCRPDFAVGVLEAAKHIFDAKGINFIFAANLEQIKKSLKHRYGDLVSEDEYLDKFIGYCIEFPEKADDQDIVTNASKYLEDLISKMPQGNERKVFECYKDVIIPIIEINKPSLRTLEKVIKYIKILCIKGKIQVATYGSQGRHDPEQYKYYINSFNLFYTFVCATRADMVKEMLFGHISKFNEGEIQIQKMLDPATISDAQTHRKMKVLLNSMHQCISGAWNNASFIDNQRNLSQNIHGKGNTKKNLLAIYNDLRYLGGLHENQPTAQDTP